MRVCKNILKSRMKYLCYIKRLFPRFYFCRISKEINMRYQILFNTKYSSSLMFFFNFWINFLSLLEKQYNNEVAFARGILIWIIWAKSGLSITLCNLKALTSKEQKNFTWKRVPCENLVSLVFASECINIFVSLNFLSSFA